MNETSLRGLATLSRPYRACHCDRTYHICRFHRAEQMVWSLDGTKARTASQKLLINANATIRPDGPLQLCIISNAKADSALNGKLRLLSCLQGTLPLLQHGCTMTVTLSALCSRNCWIQRQTDFEFSPGYPHILTALFLNFLFDQSVLYIPKLF